MICTKISTQSPLEESEALRKRHPRFQHQGLTESLEDALKRFWSKVDKNGPIPAHMPQLGKCWVWVGVTWNGYGRFWFKSKYQAAHRFIKQPIPENMLACHHCDNPICVRPDHLFIGTFKANAQDRDGKGRYNPKIRADNLRLKDPSRKWAKGENSGFNKLTESQVIQILNHTWERKWKKNLAARMGVSKSNISAILQGRSWKHVPRKETLLGMSV